jgi:outer membrane biosynthesis protein TonB
MIQERKQKGSSKVNLIISAIFHTVLIAAVVVFAAREGMLGKKLKELTVVMVPKEKKPEPPKEKPEEPKAEPPKAAEAPKLSIPQPKAETAAAPPAGEAPPAVAPAAAVLSGMDFSDGAKEVQSISDPNGIYKALVEHTLRSGWNRPEDMADDNFAAEVEVTMDSSGKVKSYRWLTGSDNPRWDNSVKAVLAQTKVISRPPPKGFPETFVVRFDVESTRTETIQLSSR